MEKLVPRANGAHHEARAAESVRLPRIWSTGLPICPPQGPKRFSKSSEGQIQEGGFWDFFGKPEGPFRGIHLIQNTQPPGPGTPISRSSAPCYIGIPENQVVWQQDLDSHEEILIFSYQNTRIWVSPLRACSQGNPVCSQSGLAQAYMGPGPGPRAVPGGEEILLPGLVPPPW